MVLNSPQGPKKTLQACYKNIECVAIKRWSRDPAFECDAISHRPLRCVLTHDSALSPGHLGCWLPLLGSSDDRGFTVAPARNQSSACTAQSPRCLPVNVTFTLTKVKCSFTDLFVMIKFQNMDAPSRSKSNRKSRNLPPPPCFRFSSIDIPLHCSDQ